jgi:4-amino-4-deoxy-L-arabinose transferase-like glycosyltransferase
LSAGKHELQPTAPAVAAPAVAALPVAALLLLSALPLMHLTALPMFEDEGSQLGWISRIIEAREWALPLFDGKPLEAWPMVPMVGLGFPPLIVMRAVHVLCGMIGTLLIYELALMMGSRASAFVTAALFAICPFEVYLQRLALSDILMSTAGLWVLLGTLKLIDSPTRGNAIALAAGLLLAAFSKMPVGFVFFAFMPAALLLMPPQLRGRLLGGPALRTLLLAHAPAALLAVAVLSVALLRARSGHAPGFGIQDLLGIGGGRYSDIAGVIGVARPNLLSELSVQLSWPVTLLALIGIGAGALSVDWRRRWLTVVGLLPMLGIGIGAHFWYSRYLLFTLPPLIVVSILGWQSLALRAARCRRLLEVGLIAVCVGFMGRQAALLISDPVAAHWSPLDRFQYIEGWGSGYGYPEAARFLLQSPDAPPLIYALDGHTSYQLRTYLPDAWIGRVVPVFYDREGRALRSETTRSANLLGEAPAWIVVSPQLLQQYLDSNFGPAQVENFSLRQVASFDKPGSRAQVAIYRVARRGTGS